MKAAPRHQVRNLVRNLVQKLAEFFLLPLIAVIFAPSPARAQIQFEQWRSLQFTPQEYSDPLMSSLTADPDHDSLKNLLEYGLGGSPKTASILPLPTFARESDHLVLSFTRVKAAIDLSYVVEVSYDLVNWYSGDAFTELLSITDRGETEAVRRKR